MVHFLNLFDHKVILVKVSSRTSLPWNPLWETIFWLSSKAAHLFVGNFIHYYLSITTYLHIHIFIRVFSLLSSRCVSCQHHHLKVLQTPKKSMSKIVSIPISASSHHTCTHIHMHTRTHTHTHTHIHFQPSKYSQSQQTLLPCGQWLQYEILATSLSYFPSSPLVPIHLPDIITSEIRLNSSPFS